MPRAAFLVQLPRRPAKEAPARAPGRARPAAAASRPEPAALRVLVGGRGGYGGGSQGFPRTPPRSWRVNCGARLHRVLLPPCRPWVLSDRVAGAALSPRGPRAPPGVPPCCGPLSPPKEGSRTEGPGGPGRRHPPRSTPPGAGAVGGRCCGLDAERDSRRQHWQHGRRVRLPKGMSEGRPERREIRDSGWLSGILCPPHPAARLLRPRRLVRFRPRGSPVLSRGPPRMAHTHSGECRE